MKSIKILLFPLAISLFLSNLNYAENVVLNSSLSERKVALRVRLPTSVFLLIIGAPPTLGKNMFLYNSYKSQLMSVNELVKSSQ